VTVRRLKIYLVLTIVLAAGSVGVTLGKGNEPVLGLDLQGGISVVLSPVGKFRPESLDVAVDIIRNRVDSLGVAEPEISRQGDNVVVDLPGVKDRDKARRLVGRTAELRFRPVLLDVGPLGATPPTVPTTTPATVAGTPESTTTTTLAATDETVQAALASCDATQVGTLLADGATIPTTKSSEDQRDACVVLPERDTKSRLYLDKTALTGRAVDSAKASFSQGVGWAVDIDFTDSGSSKWDALGAASFHKPVAIVLDGLVQSAPVIQPDNTTFQSFGGRAQITGDFTQGEADDLATIINYGALPVQLEEQTVQNVSPTLGQDQLDAGIAAGLVGLALVALYMLAYYRLLGLVVISGLLVTAAFIYSLVSYLGDAIGLTLTLAGVTGLIVSVGVTVDSYVVYFERLKDEVRSGKTVRSSVDRGFTRSFRTILAADLVSLIGAAALYFLAIGSVRGFAFYLGLSTALDLIVAYFFMHPLVSLMARRPSLVRMRGIGIGAGLDASGVSA
jgi:preprotein translocase subunit SecD